LKLYFEMSERTVSRYLAKRTLRSGDLGRQCSAFSKSHRDAIGAMEFFTVPTVTFGMLYCFFASITAGVNSSIQCHRPTDCELGLSAVECSRRAFLLANAAPFCSTKDRFGLVH